MDLNEELQKFDSMVEKVKNYLFDVPYPKLTKEYIDKFGDNYYPDEVMSLWYKNPVIIIVGNKSENIYVKRFIDNVANFQKRHSYKHQKWDKYGELYVYDEQVWYCWNTIDLANQGKLHRILAEIDIDIIAKEENFVDEVSATVYDDLYIFMYKNCEKSQFNGDRGYSARLVRDNLVFWNLFIAAIDESILKTELSAIIDMAYLLGFNNEMIRDWSKAVKYIVEGNMFGKDCDLKLETSEAKRFFLHQYDNTINKTEEVLRIKNSLKKFWFLVAVYPHGGGSPELHHYNLLKISD